VHLTRIVENHPQQVHLCEECAEAQQIIKPKGGHASKQKELNLPALVQSLFGLHLDPGTDELARLTCPLCGIKFMEFRARGRLGCPHDYTVFRQGLTTLLQRIHRATQHVGKAPRQKGPPPDRLVEIAQLRRQLQSAVDAEAYEEAARLRDLLRKKEATDESG
jgi:protein arginine kinase activator